MLLSGVQTVYGFPPFDRLRACFRGNDTGITIILDTNFFLRIIITKLIIFVVY